MVLTPQWSEPTIFSSDSCKHFVNLLYLTNIWSKELRNSESCFKLLSSTCEVVQEIQEGIWSAANLIRMKKRTEILNFDL